MKSRSLSAPLSDARIDAALAHDDILPSSGFTDAVMSAVRAQQQIPAPIAFPWKRALPGLVAAAAALAGLLATLILLFVRLASAPPRPAASFVAWNAWLIPVLRRLAAPDILWLAVALALPLGCLWILRRLAFR